LPAEVRVYAKDLVNMNLPQISGEGFTMGAVPQRPEQGSTVVNGNRYDVFTFRVPVTAVKTRKMSPGPATGRVVIGTNFRVNFFGQRFPGQTRNVDLASQPVAIDVHELPPNPPPTFRGAIGKYNLFAEAGPTDISVGDPITVKIQISGHGDL